MQGLSYVPYTLGGVPFATELWVVFFSFYACSIEGSECVLLSHSSSPHSTVCEPLAWPFPCSCCAPVPDSDQSAWEGLYWWYSNFGPHSNAL